MLAEQGIAGANERGGGLRSQASETAAGFVI
jgi:hypothetical protein